ncbi:MAG: DNA-binding response regulator [Actinomycetia bacterium]|nr:DNA-binding response regulator [Actinomycetes bacterium]
MRVLVVEDHRELAETLAVGLRREGMAVEVAWDGPAGLERTSVNRYEVVVLDRDLPGMHGDDVCQLSVLELLLAAGGRVVSAEELLERGWDEAADPFTNTVKVTISRLWRKLGDPPLIETVAQAGYRI